MAERCVTHATFVVERTYGASPARVFRAFSDPAVKSRWFGGPGFWSRPETVFEFRVGGREHHSGEMEGGIHTFDGLYWDIVLNERIVFTYDMHVDQKRISVSLATVELKATGTGTRLVFTEQGVFLDGRETVVSREHGTGKLLDALGSALDRHVDGTGTRAVGSYVSVNGLDMYYEIDGRGRPLVLLHGGGSTIESTFGRIMPDLAKTHQVIAVELQAHGHTPDNDRPLSFGQDADDVAALLKELDIERADFLGFSNGATTCLQIAIRHPELVNKLVLAAALYRRDGVRPGFFEGLQHASLDDMPHLLKEAYLAANPDPQGLQAMFDRDRARMLAFEDISDADIRAIQAPALVINGDSEVVRAEHALELSHALPHTRLAILPGGHGAYIGAVEGVDDNSKLPALVTALIEDFLRG